MGVLKSAALTAIAITELINKVHCFSTTTSKLCQLSRLSTCFPTTTVLPSSKNQLPGESLFRNNEGGGYVPYGLTAEEYSKIKEKEEMKQKKLDYGMWGPRFQQEQPPDGNWMTNSFLWTNGFRNNNSNNNNAPSVSKKDGNSETIKSTSKRRRESLLMAFGTSLFLTQLIHLMVVTFRCVFAPPSSSLSSYNDLIRILSRTFLGANKIAMVLKGVSTVLLSIPIERFILERWVRTSEGSKRTNFFMVASRLGGVFGLCYGMFGIVRLFRPMVI